MCFDVLVRTVIKTGNPHPFKGAVSDQIGTNTYQIKRVRGELPHSRLSNLSVTNQFGTILLDTWEPDRLMVPSSKSLDGPVNVLNEIRVDHFKCYPVIETENTPEFVPLQVSVLDQFHIVAKMVLVRWPDHLCNPVDKNGEGIINSDNHLLCYELEHVEDEPRFAAVEEIHTNNQFGPLELDALGEKRKSFNPRELCVPSEMDLTAAVPVQ